MSNQYLRKIGLLVSQGATAATPNSQALDLSEMQIKFKIYAPDFGVPKAAIIRVYNLTPETTNQIQKEYQGVSLQAGYQDASYGMIFQGTIKQIRRGREDSLNSFVEISASDADLFHAFGTVNTSLAAGASAAGQLAAIAGGSQKVTQGQTDALTSSGGVLIRGKTLFGMQKDKLTQLSDNCNCTWSIQNGTLQFTPQTGYLPGEAIQLNSKTGLIGTPDATDGGIIVRALLNPNFKPGGRVQINNSDINTTTIQSQGFPAVSQVNFTADVTNDGFYRILVVEHQGDNRGTPWYSDLVCLSLDGSAPINRSVAAYGG